MENKELFSRLAAAALELGAYKAGVIRTDLIETDRSFRDMCAANSCGVYGKCWMCPPDVGEIDALMAEIKDYRYALVYQIVSELEDSFDFEGMVAAKQRTYPLAQSLRVVFAEEKITHVLHLGAGGCGVCKTCSKETGEPCRFPELAMPSLEAYGINVSSLAKAAGMQYINGANTVTYFGAVLFCAEEIFSVTFNGARLLAQRGQTVSEVIRGEKPCGGHGRCGKCKVIARGALSELTREEADTLSAEELALGVRLACQTRILGECEIEILYKSAEERIVTHGEMPGIGLSPIFGVYGVAVDVGTTTLAARLYGADGRMLAEASRLNPQQEWGADVVSRIEAALAGEGKSLAEAVGRAIDGMVESLCKDAAIDPKEIDGMVITGNTVMLSLLVQEDVEPFSHAPFEVKRLFGEAFSAKELGLRSLHEDVTVYLPPCVSAFVGADTTCALLATRLCEGDTAMMADVGTNGEMALWHGGQLLVCSTAAGPAFEGVSISMGMRGGMGAIDRVSILNGSLHAHVIGGGTPVGICGSGLVDAVACMLDLELLDESGFLEEDACEIQVPVVLTQQDVRMLQLAKSAICAGVLTLAARAGVEVEEIPVLSIAGGFGNYLNVHNAARIGLLPIGLSRVACAVGNAALAGASMLLLNRDLHGIANDLAKKAELLELSADPVFSERFMSGMLLDIC